LAAGAGICFGWVLFSIYTPDLQLADKCYLYKVAEKPVTSYVLKPVVQEKQCMVPDPIIVKEKCEDQQKAEPEEDKTPRKGNRHRWRRRY
jgi:hypothetical protein